MDWRPKMNMASPPMNSMYSPYDSNSWVPNVPITNQQITIITLNMPNFSGFAPLTTPCDAKIRFSIFPKIINEIKPAVNPNILSP